MEDYNSNLLNDSKNEWSIRLMNILCGHVIDGFRSIFNESLEVCEQNDEAEKYLMTFQNFLSRIPKWNQVMIEKECARIKDCSKCSYLEDLITCVHVIQLKILSCVRTSNQVKKIDIDIPDFNLFLHNVYINIARKLYSNIFLFQVDVTPLEQQKNNREFETIVQTCIMNTIRDNIPIDHLLKQYMDETQEEDVTKEERIVKKDVEAESSSTTKEVPTEEMPPVSGDETTSIVPPFSPAPASAPAPVVTEEAFKQNIGFEEKVEKYDPVNNEKTNEIINFEPKEEPRSMYDDEEEDDYEKLNIGESIQLNLGEELEPKKDVTPIDLGVEDLELIPKNDIIDLGVEELKL